MRHYNSLSNLTTGLGSKWTTAFYKQLEVINSNTLQIHHDNGRGEPFLANTKGNWSGDSDTSLSLAQDATGYTLTLPDGASERYNLLGQLQSDTTSTGQTTNYDYDASNRIDTVTGPFGHVLTLAYDASDRIDTITDPDSGIITYGYDANNNLTRVDYPDNTAKIYHYEDTNYPNHLTGISYEDSNQVVTRFSTYGYYHNAADPNDPNNGNAILTEHAQTDNGAPQEGFSLAYDSPTQTTVTGPFQTNPTGKIDVLTFATTLGVKNLVGKVNQQDGKALTQIFDASNNLVCRQDEEGIVMTYGYNSANQRTGITEGQTGTCISPVIMPESRTTTFDYLSPDLDLPTFIRRPSVASGQTFETEIRYGNTTTGDPCENQPANLPCQIIQRGFTPSGTALPARTVTLGYNNGQVTSIDGPRTDVSDTTALAYYTCTTGSQCGQLNTLTNALGQVTTFNFYDAHGRVTKLTDLNSLVTDYTYDPRGRVETITQTPPSGPARFTQFTYTAFGDIKTVTTPDGIVLTYGYDAAQDLRSITDNLGNKIEYGTDLNGNRDQTLTKDPDGTLVRQLDTVYDLRNRIASLDAAGSVTQTLYDALGNLISETDPNTNPSTVHQYDALNRLTQTLNALAGTPPNDDLGKTSYVYDANDRLIQVTAPGTPGNRPSTAYAYDDLGNQLTETGPDRNTLTNTHDAAGNVKTQTDARGTVANYTYDELNRLTAITYPTSPGDNVSYIYDTATGCSLGVGRLCQVTDESGTTTFTYDAFGNVTDEIWQEITQGIGHVTLHGYDPADRLLSVTRPAGQDTSFTRDNIGRIAALQTGATVLQNNRNYRADGLLTNATYGNGLIDTRDYDFQGRLNVTATFVLGDINDNGQVDLPDIVLAQRMVLGIITPTAVQLIRGDVYPPGAPDGVINLSDFIRLQRSVLLGVAP